MASALEILTHIDTYMKRFPDTKNQNWYVGVAAEDDIDRRLFKDHKVPKHGVWAYHPADSSAIARQVEKAYREAGCDGGTVDWHESATMVYAYLKAPYTEP